MLELVRAEDETESEQQRLEKLARRWHARIRHEKNQHKDWRKQAKEAWDIYLAQSDTKDVEYPLLWSVTSIQHAATYSSRPVPIVKPRNASRNPSFRSAADVTERGLEFCTDQTEFDDSIHRVVDDYLVAGLGMVRAKLDAEIEDVPRMDDLGQPVVDEQGEIVTEPVIVSQSIRAEYVPWSRFGWEPCTLWDHCGWVYFKHPMRRSEIVKRYGEDASFGAEDDEFSSESHKTRDKQITFWVYEIWDKENRQVIHLGEGGREPLEVSDDPLRLTGFFSNPPPILTNVVYDALIPKPDYELISCFAEELNRLYKRRKALTEQIKALTFHDASIVELEDFATQEDGTSISIENLTERLEGGDINRMIIPWPVQEKVEALAQVNGQIDIVRRQADDMVGIGDILRGASNPQDGQETQKIKERWAGIRLRRKQIAVQHMIRNLFRIMAEITAEHFTRDNLQRMTQIDIDEETWTTLQNDILREFAVDVETDSTVAKDEFQDKRERTELLGAITQYVSIIAPAMNANAIPADLGAEVLRMAIQPYAKQARGMDQIVDQMPSTQKQLQQLQQLQGQLQQLQGQLQQRDYALTQYSQAEEARKTQESQAKAAKDAAQAEKTKAGVQDEALQAQETQADTRKTLVETQKILLEMKNLVQGVVNEQPQRPAA